MASVKIAPNGLGPIIDIRLPCENFTTNRFGRPQKAALTKARLTAEFVARFHDKYKQGPSCWEWTASRYPLGYGQVTLPRCGGKQKHEYAHRISYVLNNSDIPQGMVVMHTCDNPFCVRPSHLRLGTQKDNLDDAEAKGRFEWRRRGLTVGSVQWIREQRRSGAWPRKGFPPEFAHLKRNRKVA